MNVSKDMFATGDYTLLVVSLLLLAVGLILRRPTRFETRDQIDNAVRRGVHDAMRDYSWMLEQQIVDEKGDWVIVIDENDK